jgi:sulfite exporter TauE/SafE
MNTAILGTLLVTGFLGSLGHCLGMCGPLVMMFGVQFRARRWQAAPHHLLYHSARMLVYGALGAGVGAIGSLLGLGSQLNRLAGGVSLLLGLGVLVVAAGYLGWLPLGWLEGQGSWISHRMSQALQRGGVGGVILLGALNGILPCPLVYSALLVAASAGGAMSGGLGMIIFGAGTLPALLVVGVGAGSLSARVRQRLARVAGGLMMIVGLQLALRGAAAWGWIPHLSFGEVMLW